MLKVCLRCGYERKATDSAPDSECPSCGRIYAKMEAAHTKQPVVKVENSGQGNHMSAVYTMKGIQDLLEVFDDKITITPKGILGFLNKGLKGTKEIPFQSIVAVQFKASGIVFSGYIQFTILGGNESRSGIFGATKDENTFMFAGTKSNDLAIEIKTYIDSALRKLRKPQADLPTRSLSDELQKLAGLKEQGILSDEEFKDAKKRLIG
jgi:DNA-directed RNA polymerase subunit RPC12/RpoP